MRSKHKISALALSLIASAFASGAHAQSVDLQVTGSINPAACVPTLSGAGVIDFGAIAEESLRLVGPTILPGKTTSLTITCDAPAQVGFTVMDNRASSLASVGHNEGMAFGLGWAGESKIGAYTLKVNPVFTVDGGQGFGMYADSTLAPWKTITTSKLMMDSVTAYTEVFSVAKSDGASAPDAFQTMSATIEVEATINSRSALPLGDKIELDGSATLELRYL